MALPGIQVILRRSSTAPNPQDLSAIAHVIGPCSTGPVNQPTTITTLADLVQFGYGPAVELAAEILNRAGGPIYFTRSATSVAGQLSTLMKGLGNPVGTPVTVGTGNAAFTFVAKLAGLSFLMNQQTGNSKALSVTFASNTLTINLGTDGTGSPNTAGKDLKMQLDGIVNLSQALSYQPGGDGSGVLTAVPKTALPFGSSGTATASGPPTDAYSIEAQIVRGGAIGGATPVTLIWTADGVNFSSEQLIPGTGIVALKDPLLDTGVVLTLSGSFDVGDTISCTTTAPTTSPTDLLLAMDAMLADSSRQWGFFTTPVSVPKTLAMSIDAKFQAALQTRFGQGLCNMRDIGEGSGLGGETESQWMDALSADFAGYVSQKGLLQMCAGHVLHLSTYSLRQFRRPLVFAAAARKASIPVHEDLGKTETGPLANVLQIYHDEYIHQGLEAERFITARTYDSRPGSFFITSSPTMADPSDTSFTLAQYTALALSVGRIARDSAFTLINDSLQGTSQPDPGSGAPAGALSLADASSIETFLSSPIERFLFRPKSDGKVSASPLSPPDKYVTVLRNYSYLVTREVRIEIAVVPLGLNRTITIGISLNLPA